ncbi:MAG: 2'-deoxycytidine 5'-triphosphate deaminase domain-containing protein [Candidatus Nanoarchaeia archaeon]
MKYTLVDSQLTQCIENKTIIPLNDLDLSSHIQPSSIDIPLGNKAYLLSERALSTTHSIEEILPEIALQTLDLKEETLLLKHHTYLIETDIEINLNSHMSAKCSPKSSIGRIDVLVRCICSSISMYDVFATQSRGKLFLEITPQSFNIIVKKGVTMSQIRLFEEKHHEKIHIQKKQELLKTCIQDIEKNNSTNSSKLQFDEHIAFLGIQVSSNKAFGYVAKRTQQPINLTKTNYHSAHDFFEPLRCETDSFNNSKITIEKNRFYIFHTSQSIRVPSTHSIEMLPYSHLIGDFRAHYAGFFDPGFGGESGAIGVLEVRSYEDIVIYNKQPICAITIYDNSKIPNKVYGEAKNNYQGQEGPKLSKFFK